MKKICFIFVAVILLGMFCACGKTQQLPAEEIPVMKQKEPAPTAQPTPEPVPVTEKVEYEMGYAYLSIELPEGWEYSVKKHIYGSDEPFGISFWPEGKSGSVDLFCHPAPEGMCGTGLADRELVFSSGHTARMRTYESNGQFNHITFSDTASTYMVELGGNAHSWWKEYEEEVLQILDTAKLGKSCITADEAVEIAEPYCTFDHDGYPYGSFDDETGIWTVQFYDMSSEVWEYFYVTAEGELLEMLTEEEVIEIVGNDCAVEHKNPSVGLLEREGKWIVVFQDEEKGVDYHPHYVSITGELLENDYS